MFLTAAAVPAAAHASLRDSQPAEGERLAVPPRAVTLFFSEPVQVGPDGVRVYDSRGERMDAARPAQLEGRRDAWAVALPALAQGGYVVTWRVTSDDGHPVHGAYTFRVGAQGAEASGSEVSRLLATDGGNPTLGVALALARWVAFVSLAVLVGGTTITVVAWPSGLSSSPLLRLLWTAWAAGLAATLAGLVLQTPYARGLGWGDALGWSGVSETLGTRLGRAWELRLWLLLAGGGVLAGAWRARRVAQWWVAPGFVVAVALLVTGPISGHAAEENNVFIGVMADALHLGAVWVWVGGLIVLSVCLLPHRDVSELRAVLPRFSSLALAAVVVIFVTGTTQAWRQVGSVEALRYTAYGQLLAMKLIAFCVLVVLGSASRRWVQRSAGRRRRHGPERTTQRGPQTQATLEIKRDPGTEAKSGGPLEVRSFRRYLRAEVALVAVALALTSLLVVTPPARTALARPSTVELRTAKLVVDVTIDPARAGTTTVHAYVFKPDGGVADVSSLVATFRLPEHDLGPLEPAFSHVGPGHFSASGFQLPMAGEWQLDVLVPLSELDVVEARTTVSIR